jgi:starch synthase (maltosyl-transferring)
MRPLKIYHAHASALGPLAHWRAALERCASLGFDTLALTGLFDMVPGSHPVVLGELDRLHRALDASTGLARVRLAELTRTAADCGLSVMLDVRPDRGTGTGSVFPDQSELVAALARERALPDPRDRDLGAPGFALPWTDARVTPLLVAAWSDTLESLIETGVAGFRWIEPAAVPPAAIASIVQATRLVRPDIRFFGWTIGLSPSEQQSLAEVGWDAVASSFAWWDLRADWFCREVERLSLLGPVLHPLGDPLAACGATPIAPVDRERARRSLWGALALGAGSFVPMGWEFGTPAHFDVCDELIRAHAWFDSHANSLSLATTRLVPLTGPDAAVTVIARRAGLEDALLVAINPTDRDGVISTSNIVADLVQPSGRLVRLDPGSTQSAERALAPLSSLHLAGFEACLLRPLPGAAILSSTGSGRAARLALEAALGSPRIAIEDVEPHCNHGRFAVRRCVGELVTVEADLLCDGHIQLEVVLRWRPADARSWHEVPMQPLGNDRWQAVFPLERLGRHEFSIEAWIDPFANWVDGAGKKRAAGETLALEAAEGMALLREGFGRAPNSALRRAIARLDSLSSAGIERAWPEIIEVLLEPAVGNAMRSALERLSSVRTANPYPIEAERRAARFASWYELFPRSLGKTLGEHGRFTDVIERLPAIRAMGFDVLYFPPIHPIGVTHRKGRNNALVAAPGEPGSPYAIGGAEGGHTAVHAELGTLEEWRELIAAAARHGIELALDFAVQCSPDHPWLAEHPEWFQFRPDGSVRYAENPPKKYQDIVNVDFYAAAGAARVPAPAPQLWSALRDIVLFWIGQGVRIFRVDNPHTKPLPFWEWMIHDVRGQHPDVIFLAEAFTRPKMMARLAKIGFSQSYTYFTWRNDKRELAEYLTELTQGPLAQYFRPHFFVNTPDINPYFLQTSGRPGFLIRAALAALLSGLWGMYSGFELCESEPLPGREEYADSEKYQLRQRNWNAPGHITAEITRLNAIRQANPALHTHLGVRFYVCSNERILYFGKATPERDNVILVAISLDPHTTQEAELEIPLWEFGLGDGASLAAEDLFEERRFVWHGKVQHLRLDPNVRPFAIWRIQQNS